MLLSSGLSTESAAVRYPRLRVLANGTPVAGASEAEVVSTSYPSADRFRLRLASSADSVRGATWWADQASVLIDIELSIGGSYVNLLHGGTDSVEVDPLRGTVQLTGRDLSAGLIESRVQGTFANQTSSEIASTLAARHGLLCDIQPTVTPVGRYWELEPDSLLLDGFSRTTTEWDLLATLAHFEGFGVWVRGATLHFRPWDGSMTTLLQVGQLKTLRMERSLTLAQGVQVTVRSWHSRAASCYQHTESSKQMSESPKSYIYIVPNLTPDRVAALARQRVTELTRHQMVIAAEMPGELSLMAGQQIVLQGTRTAFDRVYTLDSIERRIDMYRGFAQRLRACCAGDCADGA